MWCALDLLRELWQEKTLITQMEHKSPKNSAELLEN